MNQHSSDIPPVFQDLFMKDVTDEYAATVSPIFPVLSEKTESKEKYAYLTTCAAIKALRIKGYFRFTKILCVFSLSGIRNSSLQKTESKEKYAYLTTFDGKNWAPIGFSRINTRKEVCPSIFFLTCIITVSCNFILTASAAQ